VRLRWFAFIVTLVLAATPVLGAVCQMDCDQVRATPPCHESASSPNGPIVRGAKHACNHDHSTGSPALLASVSARDSVASFASPVPILAHAFVPDAGVTILAMQGPPGLSDRSTSFTITILRI
jgi:hypothetical protein